MSQGLYRYQNCYALLEEVRSELNEYSTALCQGTDTAGSYDNSDIVRKLNVSQRFLFNLLFVRFPDLFLTSSDVTGSSGVYTVPSDLFRLCNITNSNGDKIYPISIQTKHKANSTGSAYLYYRKGNTIVIDDGTSNTLTFNYYKTPKELTQGQSKGGGATSITLANSARAVADYYNNVIIENVSDNWFDTITDYTAARVATIATRCSVGKFYGTVSELPEDFHHLISKRTSLMLKNQVVSPQDVKIAEVGDFREDLTETLRSFTGTWGSDVSPEELFYDFRPMM
jgi:hypothetical protein